LEHLPKIESLFKQLSFKSIRLWVQNADSALYEDVNAGEINQCCLHTSWIFTLSSFLILSGRLQLSYILKEIKKDKPFEKDQHRAEVHNRKLECREKMKENKTCYMNANCIRSSKKKPEKHLHGAQWVMPVIPDTQET
jgi:hypothetical protein